jgi:hypothetical protein
MPILENPRRSISGTCVSLKNSGKRNAVFQQLALKSAMRAGPHEPRFGGMLLVRLADDQPQAALCTGEAVFVTPAGVVYGGRTSRNGIQTRSSDIPKVLATHRISILLT